MQKNIAIYQKKFWFCLEQKDQRSGVILMKIDVGQKVEFVQGNPQSYIYYIYEYKNRDKIQD